MESKTEKRKNQPGVDSLMHIVPVLTHSRLIRHTVLNVGQGYIKQAQAKLPKTPRAEGLKTDSHDFSKAIYAIIDRAIAQDLSPAFYRKVLNLMAEGANTRENTETPKTLFKKEHGINPPSFMVVSPGKACNLQCTGCYANAGADAEKLDWNVFDRVLTEARERWGIRFMVISGGEPLAYHSEGKGILDAVEKHPDMLFMMYTNGTLITDEVAKRMAELGNISPAISVEGWRERTDERRGKGVFDKALVAMQRLRKAGVPFGMSITATKNNAEELMSDEFMDFFFQEQGALYSWIFHYMPIGRSFTLDLMPTPQQRLHMWKRSWELIDQKHYFLADFWNHGTLTSGCLAAGQYHGGGYLYIDWNGAITPCVFVPYSPANIRDIYAQGGNLDNVWKTPFFSGIRKWQGEYTKENGNWMAPCINRDHHKVLHQLIIETEPDPTDDNAEKALLDPDYGRGLEAYDQAYAALTEPIWQDFYLKSSEEGQLRERPLKSD